MDRVMKEDSKLLSYYLRHNPMEINCNIDSHGWVSVKDLCKNSKFTLSYLEAIVEEDTRYEFNSDKTYIRAMHGHSVPGVETSVPVQLTGVLYHGTSEQGWESIQKDKLIKPMSRNHVHMHINKDIAKAIGARHGTPIVLVIDCDRLQLYNHVISETGDGVYLVDSIPVDCVNCIIKCNKKQTVEV